jgi:hypothetical protein
MQYDIQVSEELIDHETLFNPPKQKTRKTRKWREIEDIKARQRLIRELHEMDLF